MQQDKFMFMLICWPRQRQQHQLQQVYYVVSLVLTHQLLFKKKVHFIKMCMYYIMWAMVSLYEKNEMK